MTESRPITILCLASYEKGGEFMQECKQQGCCVLLLTQPELADAAWPRESIDEMFFIPNMYNRPDVIAGVSYLARKEQIDRIVALDDFDVEVAASLREHLRVPGMGDTTARFFRDKLAMRVKAQEEAIRVPEFIHVLNYDRLRDFTARVPAPWMLKPRSEASSLGIQKIENTDQLWAALDVLGDRQSFYVLEKYVAGPVYHVDAIVSEREVVFAETHQYAAPLLDVAHGGGIFCSRTVRRGSPDDQELRALNQTLLHALGLVRGVTHTEFIKGNDGQFYFLETAARVGGAFISELVFAASGVNLWREWARIEIAGGAQPYVVPSAREAYAGIVISLAKQEHPDTSHYNDPEITWRLDKRHHAGLIVAAAEPERVDALLDDYLRRFTDDYFTFLPAPDKPTS